MSRVCKIIFLDEVHAKVKGLDPLTISKCIDEMKFLVPYRFHVPSFKLGRWDGSIRFFDKNGKTYINLLNDVIPILIENGYEFEFEDLRKTHTIEMEKIDKDIFAHHTWPKGHFLEGQPIQLRDDQVYAANMFAENRYGLQILATGFGKTLLTAAICKMAEPYGRTLTIVPSKSLVEQTADDFRLVELDCGVYYGDQKEYGATHTISTWQSLEEVIKNAKTKPEILESFREDLIQVLVDEAHQAKATSLNNILSKTFNDIPLRRGFTGTLPKEPYDRKTIIGNIGNVVNTVTAKELQDKGILAKCHVCGIITKDAKATSSYDEEVAYLTKDTTRLEFLADAIKEISKTGNTLVLIDRVKMGEYLNDEINGSKFVYGNTKVKERKNTYESVQDSDNQTIIATYKVAAVGINIPRIFNLIMIEPGKSFVRVIQTIGRGVRKAKDKDFVQIYDFSSNSKFSKKHFKQRKEYYDEAEYPYDSQSGTHAEILEFLRNLSDE